MRLLKLGNSGELSITADLLDDVPPYAILSHTWGMYDDEVTFEDIHAGTERAKLGHAKIAFCAERARRDGLEYFWIDTCCIDKANHSEWSEAINSMFHWYKESKKCYVYLQDVTTKKRDRDSQSVPMWISSFRSSRWFTRGWTLQELLAPTSVEFFSREGSLLGDKRGLHDLVQDITGINSAALRGAPLSGFTVDERLAWAARRNTKLLEDQVYCLLGIFGVKMIPAYGEGQQQSWSRFKRELNESSRDDLDKTGDMFITGISPITNDISDQRLDCRKKMLASLRFPQMDARRLTIRRPHSSTCAWFLEHDIFRAWTDPSEIHRHQGFLWIKGKPGTGKSTLMQFVHTNAEHVRTGNEIVLSFFFNARGEDLEKSLVGMYRSLLVQLLKAAPELEDALDQSLTAFIAQQRFFKWTEEMLQASFSSAAARLGKRRLKCFIDALDECDAFEIHDMIDFWKDVCHVALENGSEIYTCFASRHYPHISTEDGLQMILEDEYGHSEDLATYVRRHIQAYNSEFSEKIGKEICEKANGVFIWAVLVVDIVNREFRLGRNFAVGKRLQELPCELRDLYRDSLQRDSSHPDELLLCLQWVLFAKRPLSREEFYFAMTCAHDANRRDLDALNPERFPIEDMDLIRDHEHISNSIIDRFVLASSKGLAQVTRGKMPTIEFVHESVRDFLLIDNGLIELWPQLGPDLKSQSHELLRKCCLSYLQVNWSRCIEDDEHFRRGSSERRKTIRRTLETNLPFIQYASQEMLYHANEAAIGISQDSFLSELHQGRLKSLLSLLNRFSHRGIRHGTPQADLPQILFERGFGRLIESARRMGMTRHPSSLADVSKSASVCVSNTNQDSGYSSTKQDNEHEIEEDRITIVSSGDTIRMSGSVRSLFITTFVQQLVLDLDELSCLGDLSSQATIDALRVIIALFGQDLEAAAKPGLEARGCKFLRQQRKRIATELLYQLSHSGADTYAETPPRSSSPSLDHFEKVANWFNQANSGQSSSLDPFGTSIYGFREISGGHMSNDSSSSSVQEEDDDPTHPIIDAMKPLIKESDAYSRLMKQTKRLLSLDTSMQNVFAALIRPYLAIGTVSISRSFVIDWDPMGFVHSQYRSQDPSLLADAITLTSDGNLTQATTCSEYLQQAWPSSGSNLLNSIIAALSKDENPTHISNNCYMISQTNAGDTLQVTVEGSCELLLDTVEQLCWLGAACRASTNQDTMCFTLPFVQWDGLENTTSFEITFEETLRNCDSDAQSACWMDLFRNPSIAVRFPVRSRPLEARGLEVPFTMMTVLGEAERLLDVERVQESTEDDRPILEELLIIKGFQSAFIPTAASGNCLTWHFKVNHDGTYLDLSEVMLKDAVCLDVDRNELLKYRHFVGWVPSAQSNLGAQMANYEGIQSTKATRPGPGCALQNVQVTGGHALTGSASINRGTKDEAVWVSADRCYGQKIHQMRKMYVNFYDDRAQRGWLIDGASATLHIVRAQFCAQPYKENLASRTGHFKHADVFESTKNGRSAEEKALLDLENRSMMYDEDVEFFLEEKSSQQKEPPDGIVMSTSKRSRKIWTVEHMVCQIWQTLEDTWRHQRKVKPVHLRGTTREKLEGWSLRQIIDSHPHMDPRVLHLPPSSRGWVDFLREINAVTFFGRDLGDLIVPSPGITACSMWKRVPEARGYLVSRISTLREICEEYGNEDASPLQLTKDTIWHQAHLLFEPCTCSDSTRSLRYQNCDRVQVLLPKLNLGSMTEPQPWKNLNGAVIFGRSERFKFSWPIFGKPVQDDVADDAPNQESERVIPLRRSTVHQESDCATYGPRKKMCTIGRATRKT